MTDVLRQPAPVNFRRDVHCVMGLPFDAVGLDALVGHLRAAARQRLRCVLSTPNVNFIIAAQRNERFRDDILKSDLSVADGMPIIWLARLSRVPLPERVSGSDLFDRLRADTQTTPMSVFFFGGEAGVGEQARQALNSDQSGLHCAGYIEPGFGTAETLSDPALIEEINANAPDFLVLSLGAEKAQAWIERNLRVLEVPIISHLGAVVKFAAGTVARAPVMLQKTGFEWLWRMKEEPVLWRRYLNDARALLQLALSRHLPYLLTRPLFERDPAPPRVTIKRETDTVRLRLRGRWTAATLDPLRDAFEKVAVTRQRVVLELGHVNFMDSAAIGLLLLLRGHCLRSGVSMQITSASAAVRRVFRFHCVEYLLDTFESLAPITRIQPVTESVVDTEPAHAEQAANDATVAGQTAPVSIAQTTRASQS